MCAHVFYGYPGVGETEGIDFRVLAKSEDGSPTSKDLFHPKHKNAEWIAKAAEVETRRYPNPTYGGR
jgi:hypothetical protein